MAEIHVDHGLVLGLVVDVNLVAMMIVRNEADRYLKECLASLLSFCDWVYVLDDGSDDETSALLQQDRIAVKRSEEPQFFAHEGRARQALLEFATSANPTHLLAIDADEFIADGELLRDALAEPIHNGVYKLAMTEIWKADEDWLYLRYDGAWGPRPIGICYEVPADAWTNRQNRRHYRIRDAALACGRVPLLMEMAGNRSTVSATTEILHFGWACEADRAERYQRYVTHDGGQFHNNRHLESIMWADRQVRLRKMRWPISLDKVSLLERVNRVGP